jgi:hypothetical protein
LRTQVACGVLMSVLLTACVTSHGDSPVHTVTQVVANESMLLGQAVTVDGYLRFGDDSHNLWTSRRSYRAVADGYRDTDDPAWKECIALFDIDGWRDVLLRYTNHKVRVIGVLHRVPLQPDEITLSECSELGLSIKSVVRVK